MRAPYANASRRTACAVAMLSADDSAVVRSFVVSFDPIRQQYPQLQPDFALTPTFFKVPQGTRNRTVRHFLKS